MKDAKFAESFTHKVDASTKRTFPKGWSGPVDDETHAAALKEGVLVDDGKAKKTTSTSKKKTTSAAKKPAAAKATEPASAPAPALPSVEVAQGIVDNVKSDLDKVSDALEADAENEELKLAKATLEQNLTDAQGVLEQAQDAAS